MWRMNFLYLSPHFPANFQAFCEALRKLGVNVLGVDDAPFHTLGHRLEQNLTEYYKVDDLHNYEQLHGALGYFTHKYGKIDRLDSHAEYWLETEARLRTDFNIPGIQNDFIHTIKRKSLMKDVFTAAGVPVARGAVCRNLALALELTKETGYPVVAKPDIGVGAAGTYKVNSEEELRDFFKHLENDGNHTEYFFEEFICGDIFSFDGLVDRDGVIRFYTAHKYSGGVMEVVQEDGHIYYYSLREIPADLEEAGRNVLKAFNMRERFFHFEFFRKHDDGKLVALEVNMRPPGGLTTDMFNYANDINIYQEWANVIVNNEFKAEWTRPYHVVYVSRKHHLPYKHSHQDILDKYHHMMCHESAMPDIFSRALGHHAYIARSPDEQEIIAMAEYIHELEPS